MKTLDEIKGEMLLTPEEIEKVVSDAHNNEPYIGVNKAIAQAQHDKDMNFPISKDEVCPECKDTKMFGGHYYTDTCPKCNGYGTVDITVGDAIKQKLK